MKYQVVFVDDSSLPVGVEWTFARQTGQTYLFVKQSAIDASTGECPALSRAWACWQKTTGEPSRAERVRSEVGRIRVATAVLLAGYGITMLKVGSAVI